MKKVKDVIQIRQLDRRGYCRICHKDINRLDEEVITFYNSANRGGNDILCKDCICEIYSIVKGDG